MDVMNSTETIDRRLIGAVAIGTFLLFARTLGNDFISVDDGAYVVTNPNVNQGLTFSGLVWALTSISYFYWQPLTWISHMIDCTLFGLRPWGHHLTSVLLHSVNSALLFYALWRLTRNQWASLLTALLFAWHPLRVESVAWVAERKDLLTSFFWFWSLIFYERYAREGDKRSYWRSVIAMALGIASKPTIVTLPFALLLLDWWPLQRAEKWLALIREKLPFFALAAVSSIITMIGTERLGAVAGVEVLPVYLRIYNGLLSYTRYIGKMIWPNPLAFYYPFEADIPLGVVLVSLTFVVLISLFFLLKAKKRPYLPVGWFWYLGTLIPMLGLVQAGAQARADRFTYIPMIGLFVIFSWLVTQRTKSKIVLVVPVVFAVLTFQQIGLWKDNVTLFTHTLKVTPTNPFVLAALAAAQSKSGQDTEAITQLEQAVAAQPDFRIARMNLGAAYHRKGRHAEAEKEFLEAEKLDPNKADAHYMLGLTRMSLQRRSEAVAAFEKALTLDATPLQRTEAHNNLGVLHVQMGDLARADREFRAAVQSDPAYIPAHKNIVSMYFKQGKGDAAIAHLESAVKAAPNSSELQEMLRDVRAR